MTSFQPIACDLHDHLEVACVFSYQLEIRLQDGAIVQGRAVTTRTDTDKTEYLVLKTAAGQKDVAMHRIDRLRVLTPGARFDELQFRTDPSEPLHSGEG